MKTILFLISLSLLGQTPIWKATAISTQVNGVNEIKVTVRYTDGTRKFDETYTVNSYDQLKATARSVVNRVTLADTEAAKIVAGDIDTSAPVEAQPTPPTAEQIAAAAYQAKLETFRKAKWFVDAGIIPASTKAYVDLQAWLTANFKVTYLDLAR